MGRTRIRRRKEGTIALTRRSFAITIVAVATAAIALAVSPAAAANALGCLPLNGTQLTASSNDNTNILGIIYITNETYWYQDGAVNWHKTVDGGEFNIVHTNIFGAVPAAPGSTVTIPGASPTTSGSPIIVTICSS